MNEKDYQYNRNMIESICKLLNISKRTYYNWHTKYENSNDKYEDKHYNLIKLIHRLFKNKEEIDNYLEFDFLPKTYYIFYSSINTSEIDKYLPFQMRLLDIFGLSENKLENIIYNSRDKKLAICQGKILVKRMNSFLLKRPMLERLIDLIFKNDLRLLEDILSESNEAIRYENINTFIPFLFDITVAQIEGLKYSIERTNQDGYSGFDLKLELIQNIPQNILDRNGYVGLVNHINQCKINNNELVYLIFSEFRNDFKEILSELLCTKKDLQKFFIYFPQFRTTFI
ncbi:MAG: hypothetical protein DRG78_00085 [Epsilonproteobacteria bacterium]|nr:MAG: hypothetical protein DRG78_00085 [Campylobacterota bacterium]